MPIEFNCRVCDAMIRVPDKAAGGKGRCPKCGVRITVPKKSTVKPIAKPTEPEEQFVFPGVAAAPAPEPTVLDQDDSEEVVMLEPAGFHPEDLIAKPAEEFSLDKPMDPGPARSTLRRKKSKKPNKTPLIVGTIIVLAVLAGAAFFVYPLLTAEHVSGELTAGTTHSLELPPVVIDKSQIKMSSEELSTLLKKLESSPIPLTSSSMQVTLAGSEKGLMISVESGLQSNFYRVSFQENDAAKKYLDKHLSELEEQRREEVDKAATAFFEEYQNVIAKKSTSDKIAPYRDSLAIPAMAGGLGSQLVAEHGRGLYRCVYHDRDGGLYFLLPGDVTSFDIVGRPGSDGRPIIPFNFQVKVKGDITAPKPKSEKNSPKPAEKTKENSEKERSKMDDEEMDGKK